MSESQLFSANLVEPDRLDAFLRKVYLPLRSAFLTQHGAWWHYSNANRLVIQVEGQIAGYCAVIPTQLWVAGEVHPALWWVDLIIDPEYRGRGLQTLFDARVREMADLLLGFPNELAAKIHHKHRWGVREDMQMLLLPLWPRQVKSVRSSEGLRGIFLRGVALGLSPLAMLWRTYLTMQPKQGVWKMEQLDLNVLCDIFTRTKLNTINTTVRDAPYFEWRYGGAPQPQEYNYYLAGTEGKPTHYLIARHLTQANGLRYTRILDLFGDFSDTVALHSLLILAVQDAIVRGSSQVTLLASRPELRTVARQLGFLLPAPFGFCWWSSSPDLMSALAGENYWTLADSDNDAPD